MKILLMLAMLAQDPTPFPDRVDGIALARMVTQDSKADITSTETLSWKEWINIVVDARFAQGQERIARLEERIIASAVALQRESEMLTVRLGHLNDLTNEMRERDGLYATKLMSDASSERIGKLEQWRSASEGLMAGKDRGSQPLNTVVMLGIGAVIAAVVSLVATRVTQRKSERS